LSQQAVVADSYEAVWHDVQQEAAYELGDFEPHYSPGVTTPVILPGKADVFLGNIDETMVAEGDSMRIPRKILEHAAGATKGRLGVDDPIAGASPLD
jgi:hypothetical protein